MTSKVQKKIEKCPSQFPINQKHNIKTNLCIHLWWKISSHIVLKDSTTTTAQKHRTLFPDWFFSVSSVITRVWSNNALGIWLSNSLIVCLCYYRVRSRNGATLTQGCLTAILFPLKMTTQPWLSGTSIATVVLAKLWCRNSERHRCFILSRLPSL